MYVATATLQIYEKKIKTKTNLAKLKIGIEYYMFVGTKMSYYIVSFYDLCLQNIITTPDHQRVIGSLSFALDFRALSLISPST